MKSLNGSLMVRTALDPTTPDCLDHPDEPRIRFYLDNNCKEKESSVLCADVTCTSMPLTSSCLLKRSNLLVRSVFSVENKDVSNDCQAASQCAVLVPTPDEPICYDVCAGRKYASMINQSCPDMMFLPAVSVLLYHEVYFAHRKIDSNPRNCGEYWESYQCFSTNRYEEFSANKPRVVINNRTCWHLSE